MLVSAIMPTCDRREFIPQAINCFLSQTWEEKELIILDDGNSIEYLIPNDPRIRYYRDRDKRNVGKKRNICCELAKGEVVCNWDDDDWSHPDRMVDQVERLKASGKALTGYHSVLFYDVAAREAYRFDAQPQRYVLGTSQCFRREWWAGHPYPELAVGEDSQFILPALRGINKQLISSAGGKMIVARVHDRHTSPKDVKNRQYTKVDISEIPEGFFA